MILNQAAVVLSEEIIQDANRLRAIVQQREDGGRTIDLGIRAPGGLEAGLRLARVCMAGLGEVSIVPGTSESGRGLFVAVRTDHPVAACMASQYAGWKISADNYFAMGSGPMRAAAGKEPLFDKIGHRETATAAVGVLESRKLPPPEVYQDLAKQIGIRPADLTLLVAPATSQAGTIQIVARSIETAMHKLFELEFDLKRVESGYGVAPLPPVARDDMTAIGRTNDAILYGSEVTLWVRGDDDSLETIGPKIPTSASADYPAPFSEIFDRANRDFYQIDPLLFSPAVINLINLDTGHTFRFGIARPDVLQHSFEGTPDNPL